MHFRQAEQLVRVWRPEVVHVFAPAFHASLLVPAYNAAFIGLPVIWQMLLLPGYQLTWLTGFGLVLILTGLVAMQAIGRRPAHKSG